jgi:hypothetical protein
LVFRGYFNSAKCAKKFFYKDFSVMKKFDLRAGVYVVILSLFFVIFFTNKASAFNTSFEPPEGYVPGDLLINSPGWRGMPGMSSTTISGSDSYTGLYSAYLGYDIIDIETQRVVDYFFATTTPTTATGTQCFYIKTNGAATHRQDIGIFSGYDGTFAVGCGNIFIENNQFYGLYNNSSWQFLNSVLPGWNSVCISWREYSKTMTYNINGFVNNVRNSDCHLPARLNMQTGDGFITHSNKLWIDTFASTTTLPSTVEIIETPDWTGTVYVGADDYIVPTPYTKCIISYTCRLWFNYGYQAVGGTAYLYSSSSEMLDYTDLIMQTSLDDYFNIDDPATPVLQNYTVKWVDSNAENEKTYSGITVEWVNESFDDLTPDYDNLCNDIATSSWEWWDVSTYAGAFRYAIECGLRKTGYYFFVPSDASRDYFDKGRQKLKGMFPFNTYFSLSDSVYGVLATTTTDMTGTLGIPFISATSSDFYILPVLSSSSMPNAIGQDNTDLLRTSLGWLLWIVTALFIIVLVYFAFF